MADLTTEFLGYELKNPIGVASCDFGETVWKAQRVIDQGIGWLTGKTIHKIDGPHRWPRPFFFSLARWGKGLEDSWTSGQMFSYIPYDEWMSKEGPEIVKLCHDNHVMYIGSVAAAGEGAEPWIEACKDMASIGVDAIELDTGGPHATFGAVKSQLDCGAPQAMDPEKAAEITKICKSAVDIPVIFKMTPQCVHQAEVSHSVVDAGIDAITANNAFYGAWIDPEAGEFYGLPVSGGGSIGRAWQLFSLAKVLETTASCKGFPVIGVGGIGTWDDCARYLMAGSTCTGFCSLIYSRGVGILKESIDGLSDFMDRKGYKHVSDFQGCCVDDFGYLRDWPREKQMAPISPIIPKFEYENCTKCGLCSKICAYGALVPDENKLPQLDEMHCMGCGMCMTRCPAKKQVITMIKNDTGELVWDGHGLEKQWCKE